MKLLKRAAALCMAAAMAMSLSVTAFADQGDVVPTGTLTVTGDQLAGKNVTAIRMFTARATEGTATPDESYVFDSYELENAWLAFFKDDSGDGIGKEALDAVEGIDFATSAPTDEEYKAAAVAYVRSLTAGETGDIAEFAEKAQDWAVATDHKDSFTLLTTTQTASKVGETTTGSATFNSLTTGYYLVFPEGGGTGNSNRATDAMLINIPTNKADTTWNIKSTYPTVVKQVNTGSGNADNGSAQVGEVVTFTLTSAVPDMRDYDTFYFAFNDTLSNGLKVVNNDGQYVEDGNSIDSLTVTIGGKTVNSGYTVSLSGNELKIVFENLKNAAIPAGTIATGDAIVVTYKAMITEAATTTNPANNEVEVEYSNDPSNTTHGTSTPDETDVYTYEIKVNKYASDVDNLAGAKFILSTSATAPTADEIAADYVSYTGIIKLIGSDNAYRVAKPDEAGAVTSFTTTDSGDITISGLEGSTESGTTYYLHEIEAPVGYNKLKDPVTIVIKINDLSTGAATITVDAQSASGDGTVVNVENKKGIQLPETGSIGTIGLTVAGVAVVLAGVMLPRKKKNKEQE